MPHASETGRKSWRAWGLNCSAVLILVGVGACQRESPADGKADFSSAAQPGGTSGPLCGSAQDAALAQCQATTQAVSGLGKAAPTASSTTPASGAAQ